MLPILSLRLICLDGDLPVLLTELLSFFSSRYIEVCLLRLFFWISPIFFFSPPDRYGAPKLSIVDSSFRALVCSYANRALVFPLVPRTLSVNSSTSPPYPFFAFLHWVPSVFLLVFYYTALISFFRHHSFPDSFLSGFRPPASSPLVFSLTHYDLPPRPEQQCFDIRLFFPHLIPYCIANS